uniref:Uncharacterized protein n=1 Tax=Anopheles atroparvus TaxID=41427 RepID=A0AAG5DG93_ANOAO
MHAICPTGVSSEMFGPLKLSWGPPRSTPSPIVFSIPSTMSRLRFGRRYCCCCCSVDPRFRLTPEASLSGRRRSNSVSSEFPAGVCVGFTSLPAGPGRLLASGRSSGRHNPNQRTEANAML